MKFYYQATELNPLTEKPDGAFNFDGYVEAENRKLAIRSARKKINKTNAWHRKHHEPVDEYPASELPPVRFALTFLRDEK